MIQAAFFVHQHKGTVASIQRVIEPLGYMIDLVEWWQTSPKGKPHTFELVIGTQENAITESIYNQMTSLINDAKPLRSHMNGMNIYADVVGAMYAGAVCYTGDATTVYPFLPTLVTVSGDLTMAGFEHTIDRVRVYPL
ncbi:phage tail protein I [Vibrio sp. PP-XX7]